MAKQVRIQNVEDSFFTEFDRMMHSGDLDGICGSFSQLRFIEETFTTAW